MLTADAAVGVGARRRPTADRRVGRAVRPLRHRRRDPRRRRVPRRAADRSAAAGGAVLARRLVGARRPAGRHRRHAQRHRAGPRLRRRRSGSRLAERDVAVVSGLAKGIDGAAHRGALRAGSRPRRRRRRQRPRHAVPAGQRRAVGGRGRPAVCCCRSGRRAPSPSRSGSRCATASSPRSARCWWSSRAASGAGR